MGRQLGYPNAKDGKMLRNQLISLKKESIELHDALMDGDNLPQWVINKVVKALHDVTQARQYIEAKIAGYVPNSRRDNGMLKSAKEASKKALAATTKALKTGGRYAKKGFKTGVKYTKKTAKVAGKKVGVAAANAKVKLIEGRIKELHRCGERLEVSKSHVNATKAMKRLEKDLNEAKLKRIQAQTAYEDTYEQEFGAGTKNNPMGHDKLTLPRSGKELWYDAALPSGGYASLLVQKQGYSYRFYTTYNRAGTGWTKLRQGSKIAKNAAEARKEIAKFLKKGNAGWVYDSDETPYRIKNNPRVRHPKWGRLREAEKPKAAQDYAHDFNKAAYRLRGLNYDQPDKYVGTSADVQRMIDHFESQYVRMMEQGIDPALAAERLTNQWWEELGGLKRNPRRNSQMQLDWSSKPKDKKLKVGDIMYSSWGYEQTNVDFYQVIKTTKTMVTIVRIESKIWHTKSGPGYIKRMPVPGSFVGKPLRRKVQDYGSVPSVNINSYASASLWDGKPKDATMPGWGHNPKRRKNYPNDRRISMEHANAAGSLLREAQLGERERFPFPMKLYLLNIRARDWKGKQYIAEKHPKESKEAHQILMEEVGRWSKQKNPRKRRNPALEVHFHDVSPSGIYATRDGKNYKLSGKRFKDFFSDDIAEIKSQGASWYENFNDTSTDLSDREWKQLLPRRVKSHGFDERAHYMSNPNRHDEHYGQIAGLLPSEYKGGKPQHNDDFIAGYRAGQKAYAKSKDLPLSAIERRYKRVKKHGTWWIDGFEAANANYPSPTLHSIAVRLGLAHGKFNPAKNPRKRKNSSQKYAVIQVGYGIFGIGNTPTSAKREAREWLDEGSRITSKSYRQANYGDLIVVKITDELADKVAKQGGDITYDYTSSENLIHSPRYSNNPRKRKNSSQQVAQTILRQMGGAGRIVAMTGAKNFVSYKAEGDSEYGRGRGGISFKFPRPGKGKPNFVRITLTEMDTYQVEFGSIHGHNYKVIAEYDDVYASQLKPLFEKETGLYLSLTNPRKKR